MSCQRGAAVRIGLAVLVSISAGGCASDVSEKYGESEGFFAKASPGGISVFRSMVEYRGFKTYTVRSLSPVNMKRLNTLVWCPDAFPNHKKETMDWIEAWLSKGDKTLIYIGRDFSPDSAYWDDIADQKGSDVSNRSQWLSALEHSAQAKNALHAKRRQVRSVVVMPWCIWEFSGGNTQRVDPLTGPWSKGIDADETTIYIRSSFAPIRTREVEEQKKRLEALMDPSAAGNAATGNPISQAPPYARQRTDVDSNQLEVIEGISFDQGEDWTIYLATSDQSPLIAMINPNPIDRSKVMIINNASLLCNYSMLRSSHRQLASRIVDQFPNGGVGFLSGANDPFIRSDDRDDQQRGFEMLTIWPLNVVTIHAAFLGVAFVLASFPIFGRPQRRRRMSVADFGIHIEAVGNLMQKSGDTQYAMKQIADYFRNVRKDFSSPWANVEQTADDTKSPFRSEPSNEAAPDSTKEQSAGE